MRIPKVPVRLQRHRAWDPFLCTSSQSRAVHIPCWSALQPWDSQSHHPLWGAPVRGGGGEIVGGIENVWMGEQHSLRASLHSAT